MSAYWDTLAGVQAVLQALPVFAGRTVALRPALVYRADEDVLPLAIVSYRSDLWESIAELTFDNTAMLDYPVLVGLAVANAFDMAQFRWLVDAREAARKALWKTSLAASPLVFDCDYDPRPRGAELAGLGPPMQASVQQFTYRTREARASE